MSNNINKKKCHKYCERMKSYLHHGPLEGNYGWRWSTLKSNSLNQKDKYCQTRTEKNTKVLIMTTKLILTITVFLKLLLSTGFLYFICFNSYFNMIGNHFKFFGIRLQILRSIWDKSFWGFFSYLSFWKSPV